MTVKRLREILEAFGTAAQDQEVMVWAPDRLTDMGGEWKPAYMVTHEPDNKVYINALEEEF